MNGTGYEWTDNATGLLYRNKQLVVPQSYRRMIYHELHEEMGTREILLAPYEEGYRPFYQSQMFMLETEKTKHSD